MPFLNRPARDLGAVVAGLGLLLLAGCKTKPPADQYTPATPARVQVAPIVMPAGADLPRAKLIAENRRIKVGTELTGIGAAGNDKLLFPERIATEIGVTPSQMRRRFMDTMAASRRFEVFDLGVAVAATAFDIIIDAQVVDTRQELVNIEGGARAVVTTVMLSVQGKDMANDGKPLFPTAIRVTGQTGRSTGARTVIGPRDNPQSPDIQRRMGQDYSAALQRAYEDATTRVADVLRPMARVLSVDGSQIGVVGGFAHGFQAKDELVIFRSTTAKLGGGEVFASTRPVAVVRCDGVGTESSQCTVFRRDPALQPQVGDYAVLANVVAPRQE